MLVLYFAKIKIKHQQNYGDILTNFYYKIEHQFVKNP